MIVAFVETTGFTESIADLLPDDDYASLQSLLAANPELGDVMPGCGGLRKLRIGDPRRQKGTRGGARVIYLYVPIANVFYMLDVYGKHEKADLTPNEKKQLRELAAQLKAAAIATYRD